MENFLSALFLSAAYCRNLCISGFSKKFEKAKQTKIEMNKVQAVFRVQSTNLACACRPLGTIVQETEILPMEKLMGLDFLKAARD